MTMFKKAQKSQTKARVAIIGPSGSGKSYTALVIARSLGSKIAVIDSERGSASKYAGDVADFDVCEPADFSPRTYMSTLKAAAAAGYDVVVIDSLSHAWMGKGGILEQKDKSGSGFDGWRKLTPLHNELVESILSYPGHVIATLRVKTEYVIEKDANGKSVPRKVGLAPVQRDGIEFEFDIVADMDADNTWRTSKSRCPALNGAVVAQPGPELGEQIRAWLDDGAPRVGAPAPRRPAEQPAPAPPPPPPPAPDPKRAEAEAALARCVATYPAARAEIETAYHEATTANDALLRLRRIWTRLAAVKPQLPQRDTSQAETAARITNIVALLDRDGLTAAAAQVRETISEYGAELGVNGIANADLPSCLSTVEAIANAALAEVAA